MSSIDSTANAPSSEASAYFPVKELLRADLRSLGIQLIALLGLVISTTQINQGSEPAALHTLTICVIAVHAAAVIAFESLKCPSRMSYRTFKLVRLLFLGSILILGFAATQSGAIVAQLVLVAVIAAPLSGMLSKAWGSWDSYQDSK
jgi:hypothetical protein